MAAIDQMMATAAQEAAFAPAEQAAPTAAPAEVVDTPREPSQDQAADSDTEAPEQSNGQESTTEQQFSRKDARRFYERAQAAEQRAADLERQLAETNASRSAVQQKWGQRLGTPEERQRLERTIADPNVDYATLTQARQRLAEIHTAQNELAPLYEAANRDVLAHFSQGIEALDTLPGVDGPAIKQLFAAKSGPDALKLMHEFATKAVKAEYDDQIAGLKGQIKDLQTRTVVNGSQPATGNGTATKGGLLEGLLGADGLPTEEAIARAKAGGLAALGANT